MCGRYTGNEEDSDEIRAIYSRTRVEYPDTPLATGEIFPTDTVPVLTGAEQTPRPAVWGYPRFDGRGVIINARAESVSEKPSFRDSFLNRRCVVPTTGYYEWSKDKVKYRFNLPGTRLLYLGGVWKAFPDGVRFVILTTAPNASVSDVHPRMPLVLTDETVGLWTGSTGTALQCLLSVMPGLEREKARLPQ